MINLLLKYKSILSYTVFGVLTTVVNVVVYHIANNIFLFSNIVSTCIAWIVAVTFAFITNKLFVFESKGWSASKVIKEVTSFYMCRLGTGAIELLSMYLLVDVMSFNGTIMKLFTNFVVIILNFVFSKLFVFTNKK